MNNLIAIGGLKNSGKDTATNMLQYLLNSPKILHNYTFYKWFKRFFKNNKYKKLSFAHPLKKTLASFLNININKFEDRRFKERFYVYFPEFVITDKPNKDLTISDNKFSKMIEINDLSFLQNNYITIRQLLQIFGTSIMRGLFGNNIWILSTLKNKNKYTIISDLRFKVEHKAIKNNNGLTIYIMRPGIKPGNHASEQEVCELLLNNNFDIIINNNGTQKDLFDNIKQIIK